MLEYKTSPAHLRILAERARGIAADADEGVADLFLYHAEMCERAARRPIGTGDLHAFDNLGRPYRPHGKIQRGAAD